MATRDEVSTRALRKIGVVAEDLDATAAQLTHVGEQLDSLFADISSKVALAWDLATVPSAAFVPLSNLLAVEIAGEYTRPAPMTYARAFARLMSIIRENDMEDRRDDDEDGVISEAEEGRGNRALYY